MRRVLSIIFFIIGGWLLMAEPIVALIDFAPSEPWVELVMILVTLGIGAVPLAIGTAISPGDRRRELGLTVLLTIGAAAFAIVALAAVLNDPGFKPFMPNLPPMPKFAPIAGALNLAMLTLFGWLLYRQSGTAAPGNE